MKPLGFTAVGVIWSITTAAIECSSWAQCVTGPWTANDECVYDNAIWKANWWTDTLPTATDPAWTRVSDCEGETIIRPTSEPIESTVPPRKSTTTYTRASHVAGDGSEIRPTGPTGPNGECVWPEWDPKKAYTAGHYVGLEQDVYTNTYYAEVGSSPTEGAPWQLVATCAGAPPKSKYTLEEMQAMLDPNDHSYQVVYDPWTPLLPTEDEMRQAEADYRSTPLAQAIVDVNRMLPVEEVEKVSAGRAENPENVRRVESILPEALFNKFFPVRHKAYTYDHFLKSVALFPAYCGTYTDGRDSDAICKKVLATSFAHYVQETGANHGSLYYKGSEHASDNINDDADQWYTVGEKLEKVNQALWYLREMGYTENAGGDAYRSCGLVPGNMFFQLTYPCGEGVSYFGRGSKQLSWNYNYGPFSQQVYGDPKVLLNDPSSVADSWLNFASGFWFSVTPQSPKPPMLWVIDGTWVPNEADLAAGRTPGFGATINIINGGLECNGKGANHPGPANRQAAYHYFMEQLGLTVDPNEDTDCQKQQQFDQSSSAATESYYTMNWSGEAKCDITSSQTAWQLSRDGDYARCVKYFFRSHWFKDGELVSDYGLAPGQTWQ